MNALQDLPWREAKELSRVVQAQGLREVLICEEDLVLPVQYEDDVEKRGNEIVEELDVGKVLRQA